jgi:hydrogenase nickel incorporation protein HypA/HybF
MHELGITQSIVEACSARAGGAPVSRVTVEVGRLSAVVPDALRFCFDVCREGTPLEGAELEIIETPGRGRCRRCGEETEMDDFLARCRCGAVGLECIRGEELKIRSMEMA